MLKGLIFDLKRFAVHDGPGIRLTVFFKGCPLKCLWCHNPEGIQAGVQVVSKENRIGSRVVACRMEEVGLSYTVDQLIKEIEKDVLFFDDSGGGVTFSGGEPMMQPDFLEAVLKRCREMEIHTAVDTSGFTTLETLKRITGLTDLFLFDIKLIDNEDHKFCTGVSNKQILTNLKWLSKQNKQVIIRFPVIPGFTDSQANINRLKQLTDRFENINHIALLPFHNIAAGKYERFGMKNTFDDEPSMNQEQLLPLKADLEAHNLKVTIGG